MKQTKTLVILIYQQTMHIRY